MNKRYSIIMEPIENGSILKVIIGKDQYGLRIIYSTQDYENNLLHITQAKKALCKYVLKKHHIVLEDYLYLYKEKPNY